MSSRTTLLPPPNTPAPPRRTFRTKVAVLLERPETHWAVIILSLVDALMVVSELVYDELKDKTCICDDSCPETPALIELSELLSIIITSTFVVEIPLALYAFHLRYYKSFWHALDAVVVLSTFALEVFLRGTASKVASLLVLLRLWRIIKLVGSMGNSLAEYHEEANERRKHQISTLHDTVKQLERENKGLRRRTASSQLSGAVASNSDEAEMSSGGEEVSSDEEALPVGSTKGRSRREL